MWVLKLLRDFATPRSSRPALCRSKRVCELQTPVLRPSPFARRRRRRAKGEERWARLDLVAKPIHRPAQGRWGCPDQRGVSRFFRNSCKFLTPLTLIKVGRDSGISCKLPKSSVRIARRWLNHRRFAQHWRRRNGPFGRQFDADSDTLGPRSPWRR